MASKKSAAPKNAVADTVDAYIAGFPPKVRAILNKIRKTIRQAVPDAHESISYKIPAYKLNGVLLYFAAFKAHIGLYPLTASLKKHFAKEVAKRSDGKATLRLPLNEPIPYNLIAEIAAFRAHENRARKNTKNKSKASKA